MPAEFAAIVIYIYIYIERERERESFKGLVLVCMVHICRIYSYTRTHLCEAVKFYGMSDCECVCVCVRACVRACVCVCWCWPTAEPTGLHAAVKSVCNRVQHVAWDSP